MTMRQIVTGKKTYLDLLLLADDDGRMLDRYLERGTMWVLEEDGLVRAECVVTDEGDGVLEIKNLAVRPQDQGRGYGRAVIEFLAYEYAARFEVLQVGTGESPLTLPFYEKCGFAFSHRIANFFTDNYEHPIVEGGVLLKDMVVLRRRLSPSHIA